MGSTALILICRNIIPTTSHFCVAGNPSAARKRTSFAKALTNSYIKFNKSKMRIELTFSEAMQPKLYKHVLCANSVFTIF